jgi:hypothetical protein
MFLYTVKILKPDSQLPELLDYRNRLVTGKMAAGNQMASAIQFSENVLSRKPTI